jgi:hypothetical protein
MNFNEFAESIKAKHPQYKEVDNLKLAKAMVEKYPQYKEKVTFETDKPKEEYTPKPIEYNLEDPAELAQAISQKEGVTFQDAQQRVAGFPRKEKALMQGDKFPIVSTAFDVASAPMRGLSGLASAFTSDTDPMERMSRTQAPKGEGVIGTIDEFGQNILTDPLTPLGAGISQIARQGIAKVAPKLGATIAGGLEGLGAGSIEFGLEQAKRSETGEPMQGLLDYGMQAGLGGAIGLGAGKLQGMKQAKQEIAEAPSVLKNKEPISLDVDPTKNEQKMLSEIKENTGFNTNQAKSIPIYAREMFANVDNEGKEQLNKYINQARNSFAYPEQKGAFDEVGKMFVRGEEAIGKARQQAGAKMGDIESQYLAGGEIKTEPLKARWNTIMEDLARAERVVDDGKVTYVDAPNRSMIDDEMMKQFTEIDARIHRLGDVVSGQKLRDIEQTIGNIGARPNATRSGVMNSTADRGAKLIVKDMRDLVGEQIKKEGGQEAFDTYNKAKKDYGEYWKQQDFIQRRLGLLIEDEAGEKMATRGGSMVKAMTNSVQNRNTPALARVIKELTGEDIGKHAIMAKFATHTAGDPKAGFSNAPNISKSGLMDALGGWVKGKTLQRGQTPQTFEGMTELVQKAQPQRGASFLDLIGNNPITSYGAKGLQNFGQPALRSGVRSWDSEEQQGLKGLGGN